LAQTLRINDTSVVGAVRWLPSKHHILFSGDNSGILARWDIRSNRGALSSTVIKKGTGIRGMRLTSDGKHLVVVLCSGAVILYDAVTMELLAKYESRNLRKLSEKMLHALGQFAICDEGTSIRVALPTGDDIDWIRFSKVPGFRQEPRVIFCSTFSGHLSHVNACVYRIGSQQLYTAGSDRNVLCWAPESERHRLQLETETVKQSVLMNDWSDDD
uniref:WD_REPEATS_REGION domain-containing protein n=1 Tax=Angiostrongylus cantonensis TaxID=6313 RepID=A0A158PCW3_ANGCA